MSVVTPESIAHQIDRAIRLREGWIRRLEDHGCYALTEAERIDTIAKHRREISELQRARSAFPYQSAPQES